MCATTPVVHHSGAHCVPQEMLSKFETTRVHGVQLVEMAAAIDGPGRSPTLLVDPGHEGRYLGISAAQDGPLSLVATSFVVYVPPGQRRCLIPRVVTDAMRTATCSFVF